MLMVVCWQIKQFEIISLFLGHFLMLFFDFFD